MTKKLCWVLVFLFVLAACGTSSNAPIDTPPIQPADVIEEPIPIAATILEDITEEEIDLIEIPPHDDYIVSLDIDPLNRTVYGISRITYTNRSSKPRDTIVLGVYLNTFAPSHTPRPYPEEFAGRVYRSDLPPGFFNVEYASINNETLEFDITGSNLTLFLPEPIEPNVTVQLLLQYSAYVPPLAHLLGGNDYAMWFGSFLPILGPVDYFPVGLPFSPQAANYDVSITTPITHSVIGTGHRTEEIIEDANMRITRFTANMVRDFTFAVLSPEFERANITADSGIEISLYYLSENIANRADEILDFSNQVATHFGNAVGRYPFGQITILESEILTRAAPFSGIIFANSSFLGRGDFTPLANSIGSQWTGNVIGANRAAYPWLDIGLAHFIQTELFFETAEMRAEHIFNEVAFLQTRLDLSLSHSAAEIVNLELFIATHTRFAAAMFNALQERLGIEIFEELLHLYFQEFSFRTATKDDFFALAEELHGRNLADFILEWFD